MLAQGTQFIATQALGIGQNTFEFVAGLFITLYLAFFLIRDGESLARAARRVVPLAPAHQRELLQKFRTVIRATVKGNLVVAALQGLLGGLAFWVLGVGGALLWAVLMAFLSLVPAVGAALVWVPVALYFFVTGALWQGVALTAWGVLVIGLVDNLLRPLLVGKDTRMPDYVVLTTTLGGMAVLGINGFVRRAGDRGDVHGAVAHPWQHAAGLRSGPHRRRRRRAVASHDDHLAESTMPPAPFFHDDSGAVRFWVLADSGASCRRHHLEGGAAPLLPERADRRGSGGQLPRAPPARSTRPCAGALPPARSSR